MTKHPDIFKALAAPIPPEDIRYRPDGRGGKLAYITPRTAAIRLDETVGPENWQFDLKPWGADLIGILTLTLPDGTKVSKSDVGGRAGMPKGDDDAKSAASDCLKRCAALWGVGRELYGSGVADYEDDAPSQARPSRTSDADSPVHRPREDRPAPRRDDRPREEDRRQHDGPPKTGRALFAFAKKQEEQHGVGLIKYLQSFAKLNEFDGRLVDLNPEQVAFVYAEALKKLQTIKGDAYEEALAN